MRDRNLVLRRLPIVAGVIALLLLFLNRVVTPSLTASQARSDVLGAIICALLVLTGLLWEQVQPRPPEAVQLQGDEGFDLAADLPDVVKKELAWASWLLLTNTATKSLVLWYGGRTLLRRGILGPNPEVQLGPIASRVLATQKPVYLVDLKLYPGRLEFDYLPDNAQGVICQPIGIGGLLVLGANAPRSYTKQDENLVEAIAQKLQDTFASYL